MNTPLNSFISILLLFSLFTLFNEVTAVPFDTGLGPEIFCDGFQFISPDSVHLTQFKNNNEFEVVLTKGDTFMSEVKGLDLVTFGTEKFVKKLWRGNKEFGADGKVSLKVKVEVPKQFESKLPTEFMFRSWGPVEKATCTSTSAYVTIYK
ncbi:12810_t:CDS:2 [Funneliformis mosseae]|uniref:12810_t:CDS:1 n=1 Tax=Funneliformis mosseae TaxID=27381 RepID=A0A9N9BMR2_FUNMO|nr:12810_t:CDS:2 [Funneliformis mosseae]